MIPQTETHRGALVREAEARMAWYLEKAAQARAAGMLVSAQGFEKLAGAESERKRRLLGIAAMTATLAAGVGAAGRSGGGPFERAAGVIGAIGENAPTTEDADRIRRKQRRSARRNSLSASGVSNDPDF
jgi:hypothetical protein